MTFQILVVCAANICRSPIAQVILQQTFARAELGHEVSVLSAGVSARVDRPRCDVITGIVSRQGVNVYDALDHTPVQLRASMIAGAGLILTADRATRAATLRMHPSARSRAFTIRQALALGSDLLERGISDAPIEEHGLGRFIGDMDLHRGMTELPGVTRVRTRKFPWKSTGVHAYDIPDAHQQPGDLHGATATLLMTSTEGLARILAGVAALKV